jgi:glutamate synthase (NADPH/NADH) large chain
MTGGLAWVYDADGNFVSGNRFHPDFITPEPFAVADSTSQKDLRALIEQHVALTDSGLAKAMLADWGTSSQTFIRLTPKPQA